MPTVDDRPQPPCDAYLRVERVLPPNYLVVNQPPVKGRKLMVFSHVDERWSNWEMDLRTAVAVISELRRTDEPVDIKTADYDNTERKR